MPRLYNKQGGDQAWKTPEGNLLKDLISRYAVGCALHDMYYYHFARSHAPR